MKKIASITLALGCVTLAGSAWAAGPMAQPQVIAGSPDLLKTNPLKMTGCCKGEFKKSSKANSRRQRATPEILRGNEPDRFVSRMTA